MFLRDLRMKWILGAVPVRLKGESEGLSNVTARFRIAGKHCDAQDVMNKTHPLYRSNYSTNKLVIVKISTPPSAPLPQICGSCLDETSSKIYDVC